MEIGNPAIADDIAGLRIAYRSGLDVGACELRVRKVAGTDTRERLVACTHAADTLARAFLNCRNVSKAAHYRGVGDAYAKAANLTDFARGLPLPLGGLELREVARG